MVKPEETAQIGRIAYTPMQAALATGRSRSRIFQAIKKGDLSAKKDGKSTLIEDAELRRWIGALPTIGRNSAAA